MAPALLALVSSLACLAPIVSGSSLPGFTLIKRAPGDFGYSGARGPANWINLDPNANALCGKGRNQSPINLVSGGPGVTTVNGGNRPTFNYPTLPSVKFENLGTTVEAFVTGSLTYAGATWNLVNFHFHTPSEHRLNEEHYPLEVHFVHQRAEALADGSRPNLVIGVWFQISGESEDGVLDIFKATLGRVEEIPNKGQSINTNRIDFSGLTRHLNSNSYLSYPGSLTVPPCTEGVTWLVSTGTIQLSVRLYNNVKRVLKFNSRFAQNNPGQENVLDLAADLL